MIQIETRLDEAEWTVLVWWINHPKSLVLILGSWIGFISGLIVGRLSQ